MMPFIEVITRQPLSAEIKSVLAEDLTARMIEIEAGPVEDESGARAISWVTFQVIKAEDWAIGGRLDDSWAQGRTFALAKVIAPEAILSSERKARVLAGLGAILKKTLVLSSSDDGTGIQVQIFEIPESHWGVNGTAAGVRSVLQTMGEKDAKHYGEAAAHYEGIAAMKRRFAIPQ